jgi:hypothetical protein
MEGAVKDWVRNLDNVWFSCGLYSQSYQDALSEHIFERIGTHNATPRCVEIGFNSDRLAGGSGSTTARLILERKWGGLLIDAVHSNQSINLHQHVLTSTNVCAVLRSYDTPSNPEYISIDVDSIDLWLFEAIAQSYRPMVFSVEYNSHFPLRAAVTFPNDNTLPYSGDRGYGASLAALNIVAANSGYSLLWVVPRLDAFFIRNDIIEDGTASPVFPIEKWDYCTELVHHRPVKRSKAQQFLDYGVWIDTDGDVEASRRAAYPICKKHLMGSWRDALRLTRRIQKQEEPCPFCGSWAGVRQEAHGRKLWCVNCFGCGAQTAWMESVDAARAKWERRVRNGWRARSETEGIIGTQQPKPPTVIRVVAQ